MEVVNDLGHDPRPVDRVHRHQASALEEALVGEAGLDHFLAIVEVAFNRDVVNVLAEDGRHLPTLNFRNAVVRMQNEDVDVVATTAPFDGGRTGITRGGTEDHHALATLLQHIIEQATEQLQSKILERQRRAVEQLEHPFVTVELTQRRNSAVGERTVGFFKDILEVHIRNATADKRAHHPECQLVVWQAGPGGNFFLSEAWQVFWHVQAAIAGQTGQQDIFEIQGRCLAAGTDITHDWLL